MNRLRGIIFALVLIAVALSLRAPFLKRDVWNLDEASTFTMAQQILDGAVLFRDAADNRSPLVPYLKAAVFAVAGDWNAFAVHLLLVVGIGLSAVGVWRIAARLRDESTGIWAAVFFTFVSFLMLEPIDTLSAHTGWFLIFFSIGGFWLFVRSIHSPTFGAGIPIGVLFGFSALCKQPGILDFGVTLVLLGLLAVGSPGRLGTLARMAAGQLLGFLIVLLLCVFYFAANDALSDLIFYAWSYNTHYYVPEVPLLERLAVVRMPFDFAWNYIPAAFFAGVLGAAALIARVIRGLRKPVRIELLPWLILGWTAAGLVSTMLSGRGFSHYNIQVMPGLSLACGWFAARAFEFFRARGIGPRALGILLLVVAVISTGRNLRTRFVHLNPLEDIAKSISEVVARHSGKSDPVLVWGYYPEYYFFSQRMPSTRFIYTNYLTGLIPWTNVDSLIDTKYASIPGGWDQFWSDLERKPPRVIIDTGGSRGYLKYPLHKQPRLWSEVVDNFAAIEESATQPHGVRIYKRLDSIQPNQPAPEGTDSDQVQFLDSMFRDSSPQIVALKITAPKGAYSVELLHGDTLSKRVLVLPEFPCEVTMLVDLSRLDNGPAWFRAAVHTGEGVLLSRSIDVAAYATMAPESIVAGPPIAFGSAKIEPIAGETAQGPLVPADDRPGFWRAHAPSKLTFRRPNALRSLAFKYGIEERAYPKPDSLGTDGVDFLVTLETDAGEIVKLFHNWLDPRAHLSDRGTQAAEVSLPRNAPGNLVFQTLPGRFSDAAYDWGYWGELTGEPVGPCIEFGVDQLTPEASVTPGDGIMYRSESGTWIAHAPSRLEYARNPAVHAIIFGYGIEEGAHDEKHNAITDGYSASLSIVLPNGESEVLYERWLDPSARPEDRGAQSVRVQLPLRAFDRIILKLDPGPAANTAFDWTYFTSIRAQGFGPDIEFEDGRRMVPFEGIALEDGRIGLDTTNGRWLSHAPARMVYSIPAGLASVTFGFGLDEKIYENESGGVMSDGVDALVFLEEPGASPVELFRRRLNPHKVLEDRGLQFGRVDLPAGASGRLVFVMGPGANANNGYDWAYWLDFRGTLGN